MTEAEREVPCPQYTSTKRFARSCSSRKRKAASRSSLSIGNPSFNARWRPGFLGGSEISPAQQRNASVTPVSSYRHHPNCLGLQLRNFDLAYTFAQLAGARNGFAGCIASLFEILRRRGLLAGRWCLDPAEDLSPGQLEEIERVSNASPELNDDEFVRSNLGS